MRRLSSRSYGSSELAAVVGARIRAFRRERRWTREHLSTLLEIRVSWLQGYEEGRALPPTYTLYQLAGAFGVSVAALLDETPQEQPLSLEETLSLLRRMENLAPPDRRAVGGFLRTVLEAIAALRSP
ncbi:MAG TPA: helix-turn-helix transcriptional regulator [Thermoanaerobaculia bacterium]|jgi:transcriptional regulator with XRE-family HTH domain